MNPPLDRLYELLPAVYRQRDVEQGQPLRALLQIIDEQADVVETDIGQLYENWFIETCQDWVVPYIGDLVGYRLVHEAGEPGAAITPRGQQRNKILIPRREVANTVRYRRRKGTLGLLELLANDTAGWPARAVEFYRLLRLAQAINHLRPTRGRTVDVRNGVILERLDGPFDDLAHTVDVRRITSHRSRGRYNMPTVGLFVWRLKAYSVTQTLAQLREKTGARCYTFSILGNDTPLYTCPEPERDPAHIASDLNLPTPIRRRAFEAQKTDYYGKSLEIRVGKARRLVPPEQIVSADLKDWYYRPKPGRVAVDPERGRIAFAPRQGRSRGGDVWDSDEDVWVSYYYGFSADVGGGEYDRSLLQPEHLLFDEHGFKRLAGLVRKLRHPSDSVSRYLRSRFSEKTRRLLDAQAASLEALRTQLKALRQTLAHELNQLLTDEGLYELAGETEVLIELRPQGRDLMRRNRLLLERHYADEIAKGFAFYRIGERQKYKSINDALAEWRGEKPRHAVVEIADSGVYTERINITLGRNQTLQLRAANRTRPVIRLLDWRVARRDALSLSGRRGSRFVLDGLLIAGQGIQIAGEMTSVTIRHSTLVPGWALHQECEPTAPTEPSLLLFDTPCACVNIEHSIVGSLQFTQDEARAEHVRILISDSILDATSCEYDALTAPGRSVAPARLTIARSTVFGRVQVHAIDLAENTIFDGLIKVARRRWGCMRFCYITPDSRTPRRYNCQPDLVEQAVSEGSRSDGTVDVEKRAALQRERQRVRPRFSSVRYGTPTYCQLAETCAEEIKRGADDESEMGVFHDLFQPQRKANLQARLDEYTPAGMEAGIIFAS